MKLSVLCLLLALPALGAEEKPGKQLPLAVNSGQLKREYEQWGGPMTLEVIKGGGHDVKAHWFTNQKLVDFVSLHASGGRAIKDDEELRRRIFGYLDEHSRVIEK